MINKTKRKIVIVSLSMISLIIFPLTSRFLYLTIIPVVSENYVNAFDITTFLIGVVFVSGMLLNIGNQFIK